MPGIVDIDFLEGVLDVFDNCAYAGDSDFAGATVESHANVEFGTIDVLGRLGEGLLHRLQHNIRFDQFLACNRIRDLKKFKPVCARNVHFNTSRVSCLDRRFPDFVLPCFPALRMSRILIFRGNESRAGQPIETQSNRAFRDGYQDLAVLDA